MEIVWVLCLYERETDARMLNLINEYLRFFPPCTSQVMKKIIYFPSSYMIYNDITISVQPYINFHKTSTRRAEE